MAAVRPSAPTHQDPGIDYVGNDIRKALRVQAYYEATEIRSLFAGGEWRECQMTNYDGRCRGGWAFGQGFDSPQGHLKWIV